MSQNKNGIQIMKQDKEDKIKTIQKERLLHEQNKSMKSNHRKNYLAIFINLILLLLAVFIEILILSKELPTLFGTILIIVLVVSSFMVSTLFSKNPFSKKNK